MPSLVFELSLTLTDERGHAFFLILGRKQRMEHPALKTNTFRQADFKRTVDAFLGKREAEFKNQ